MEAHKKAHVNAKGSIVLTIILSLLTVTILTTTIFYHMSAVQTSMQSVDEKQQAFYFADGLRSVMASVTQDYLATTAEPKDAELKTLLQAKIDSVLPADKYKVKDLSVIFIATNMAVPVPSGSFSGMNAPQTRIEFKFTLVRNPTGNSIVNYIQAEIALAQISMFQFAYFADLAYADFAFGPLTQIDGRVHGNGDLCIGGNAGVTLQTLTSAGRIMDMNDGRCRIPSGNWSYTKAFIASGPNLANPMRLNVDSDYDCKNCDKTGLSWKTYATNRWNGNVQDFAHGIQPLKLPVPNGVSTQQGTDGADFIELSIRSDACAPRVNSGNIRFTVDPELPTDGPDVRKQKFASQADLRIIDGVWYLNIGLWPGTPIWSDHPGSFTDSFGKAAGQKDLALKWGWTGPPQGFSYYGYDPSPSVQSILGQPGVISYGSLSNDPVTKQLYPGFWIVPGGGATGVNTLCPPSGGIVGSPSGFLPLDTAVQCTPAAGGQTIGSATKLLLGTRTGFTDGHVSRLIYSSDAPPAFAPWNKTYYNGEGYSTWYARVSPVNFDLDAFQTALLNKTPGALGSYFGPGSAMGRDFNGIIYISSTWPGSQKGFFTSDIPDYYPPQGSAIIAPNKDADNFAGLAHNLDTQQIGPMTGKNQMMNTALPYPLCSQTAAGGPQPNDKLDGAGFFKIPDCASYGSAPALTAYPNAVRITNGRTLKPKNFPHGLSLISNIAVYVAGDMNTNSNPLDLASQKGSSKWMPLLIGGDQVTFLSNAWDDKYGDWNKVTGEVPRPATTTTYNMALITGWARSTQSQPMNSIPALMEDWTTVPGEINFNGSIMVGFYPVYYRHGRHYSKSNVNSTYMAGVRNISYDRHFDNMVNQPPGTPTFNISSIINWKTE